MKYYIDALQNKALQILRFIKRHLIRYGLHQFSALGVVWGLIEPFLAWNGIEAVEHSYWIFVICVLTVGTLIFVLNGLFFQGFLLSRIVVSSSFAQKSVGVFFGDIFKEPGWIAIAVNDFFDGQVDERLIHSSSLHGTTIHQFWNGDGRAWKAEIDRDLPKTLGTINKSKREGNKTQFPVGTTASVNQGEHKFLFVVLGQMDVTSFVVSADAERLMQAVKGLIRKAQSTCGNEQLNIPLMGSGLGRIEGGPIVLVDLMLIAIFEEAKNQPIRFPINICLHNDLRESVNLEKIDAGWK